MKEIKHQGYQSDEEIEDSEAYMQTLHDKMRGRLCTLLQLPEGEIRVTGDLYVGCRTHYE
jgi:hypothetical protein